jgi:hypothetical protein
MSINIQVNDENLALDLSDVTDLASLVKKIKSAKFEPGELIVSLTVDGERMDVGALETEGNPTSVSEISSVQIATIKRPFEKAAELLRGMGEYLGRLSEGVGGVADKFRIGSEEEANTLLGKALDGLGVFTELLETVKHLSKTDLSAIVDETGEILSGKETRLLKALKDLEAAQVNKDWVLVADILEYDVAPLIGEWRKLLPLVERELLKGGN